MNGAGGSTNNAYNGKMGRVKEGNEGDWNQHQHQNNNGDDGVTVGDQRNISQSSSADDNTLLDGELISVYSMDSSSLAVGTAPVAPPPPTSSAAAMSRAATTSSTPDRASANTSIATEQASEMMRSSALYNPENSSLQSAGSSSSTQKVAHLVTTEHDAATSTLTEVATRLGQHQATVVQQQQQYQQYESEHGRPELFHQRSMSENSETSDFQFLQQQQQQHTMPPPPPRGERNTPQHKGRFVVQPQSPVSATTSTLLNAPPLSDAARQNTTTDLAHQQESQQNLAPSFQQALHHPVDVEQQQQRSLISQTQVPMAIARGATPSSPSGNKQPPVVIRQRSMPSNVQLAAEHTAATQPTQPPPNTSQQQQTSDSSQPDLGPTAGVPDANGQIVTKKKGRFNFLEQAPSSRSASPGRMPEAGTAEGGAVERQRHERSLSASAAPTTKVGGGHTPPNQPGKTYDSSGAPVVTKKGRFVVTSVAPVQTPGTEHTSSQSSLPMDAAELQSQSETGSSAVSAAATAQTVHSANTTGSIAVEQLAPTPSAVLGPGPASNGPSVMSNRVSPVPMAMQPASTVASELLVPQPHPHISSGDEPGPSSFTSASAQTRGASTARPTATRHVSSALPGQQQGFGKLLYFLDQMRLEVSEADKNMKSVQTDMKCLKEKNKELEAKAREMERKWNQEKSLREVAETRVKALKKKLKALENQSADADPKEDESVATHLTSGLHSRANSMDGAVDYYTEPFVSNATSSLQLEASNKLASESTGTLDTIDGTSSAVPLARTSSILRPSMDGSPPRDNIVKKKLASNSQSPTVASSGNSNSGDPNAAGMFKSTSRSQLQPPAIPANFPTTNDIGATNTSGDSGVYSNSPHVLGPPPRPKTRHDNSINPGTAMPHTASDFDPLRAVHHDQFGEAGPSSSTDGAQIGPQHFYSTFTEPNAIRVPDDAASLLEFQNSLHPGHGMPTDGSIGSHLQFVGDHHRIPSGNSVRVTTPYQDNPMSSTAESVEQYQEHQHMQATAHFTHFPQTQSSASLGQQSELFSDVATSTDPFDELVQRRPTNGSQ